MKNTKGFTLIELLVVIVIIGVLMSYAIPSYQRNVIIAKRSEAHSAILHLASAEEKHNAVFNTYTTVIGGTGTDGNSLGITAGDFLNSPDYDYSIAVAPDTGYTITARARVLPLMV